MSYQVLARKYRPGTLQEVVGQDRTVLALTNAFNTGRLHHAYLLSGTRGVGKTTLARIIAKCLNCVEGPTSTPCGVCENCVAINDGSFVDLIEVDGASRNKVEDTRDLLDDIAYQAAMGRFKVYIIDEVHALSDSSFQTLLKSLEEPPEHVKFVLATTNPDSVPVTVRSRCIQFHLRNIASEVIEEQLRHVLQNESVEYDAEAVHELARMGHGSMRDALSLTDQAISLCGSKLGAAEVSDMLGCAPQNDVENLLKLLVESNRDGVLQEARELTARGVDYSELLAGLEAKVYQYAMDLAAQELKPQDSGDWRSNLTGDWLQQAYQILIMGGRDLQYAPEPRIGFEMTLLRLMSYLPVKFNEEEQKPKPIRESSAAPAPSTPIQAQQPTDTTSHQTSVAENTTSSSTRVWHGETPESRAEARQQEFADNRRMKVEEKQKAMESFEKNHGDIIDSFKSVFPSATFDARPLRASKSEGT